ncbi:uncharacterized protein LOC134260608 [Saccostrea cucullata]|uniref:uncharacterized protein LOC134260608 n=1 Tax=Saccostrea cuccullata TaxID=36930 RepID=UPI002ED08B70
MGYFKDNKICTSSQTEKVVVIQDETEITDLLAKQNEAKKRKTVSTQTDSRTSCEASVQTESYGGEQSSVHGKLDEILSILRATSADLSLKTNNIANVSDIVRWVTENTSTPKPGLPSITIVPVEDSILEIPARYRPSATPVIEVIQEEEKRPSPVKVRCLTPLRSPLRSSPLVACRSSPLRSSPRLACRSSPLRRPTSPPASSSSPSLPSPSSARHSSPSSSLPARRASPLTAKKTLFAEENVDHEGSEDGVSTVQEVAHRVNNRKKSKDDQVLTVPCSSTATILEIKDVTDVVPGDFEFRIRRDILADVKSTACSDGNFMWILTRKLFREDELVERNFFGRKGRKPISPRRKRALTHAYIASCGTSYKEFTKAVNSINNGIRSLGR